MITSTPLPSSFNAGVLVSPYDLQIQEIPTWPLGSYGDDDMVLVEVEACGVCGSDFRYFMGENPWAQHTLGHFVPNQPNIVLGHEYAGTVVAVLSEENRHLLGKRVAPICSKVCGQCHECSSGIEHLCPHTIHMGHGQGWGDQPFFPGAYGRFAPAWGKSCYVIPNTVPSADAAMMDILAVCVHVARQGNIQVEQPVLCIGAGPAGNGVAQAALAMGASEAVLLDTSPKALEIAKQQGFTCSIHTDSLSTEELSSHLHALAPNGFASVFDSVGTAKTLDLGLMHLAKRGTLVNMAVHDQEILFNYLRLGSERRITTSCNFELKDFEVALQWLEHRIFRVGEWMTEITLDEIPTKFREVTADQTTKSEFKFVLNPLR